MGHTPHIPGALLNLVDRSLKVAIDIILLGSPFDIY